MNTKAFLSLILVAAGVTARSGFGQASSGAVNDPYTLDLLRRTLEEQKKHPGTVIRSPDAVPSTATRPPAPAAPAKSPEVTALEKDYLDGKITARQFQKALEQALERQYQREKGAGSATNAPGARSAVNAATSPKAATASGTKTAPTPAFPSPPTQPNPGQRKLSEVEQRIEEMMRKKAEREKAAREATEAANQTTGIPQTKRQRLDALLRQVVEGKLTDAEYKIQREKIAAEPD